MEWRESRLLFRQPSADDPEQPGGRSDPWFPERQRLFAESPAQRCARTSDIEQYVRHNPRSLELLPLDGITEYFRSHHYQMPRLCSLEQLRIIAERLVRFQRDGIDQREKYGGAAMVVSHNNTHGKDVRVALVLFTDFLARESNVCYLSSLEKDGAPVSRPMLVDPTMLEFLRRFVSCTPRFEEWLELEISRSYLAHLRQMVARARERIRSALNSIRLWL